VMMWIGSNPLRRAFIVGLFSIKEWNFAFRKMQGNSDGQFCFFLKKGSAQRNSFSGSLAGNTRRSITANSKARIRAWSWFSSIHFSFPRLISQLHRILPPTGTRQTECSLNFCVWGRAVHFSNYGNGTWRLGKNMYA
jgi:hypothetical protein